MSALFGGKKGSEPVKKIGDVGQIALPVLAGGMTFVYRDFQGTLEFAESFGTTMAATYILKPLINEQRPPKSRQYRPGKNTPAQRMSFPSGHTAAAFGGAAFLQIRYGWGYGVPCYLVASYVGFSRVYGERHWFRDVLGGAAIALAANVLFTRPDPKRRYKVEPILEKSRSGFSFSVDW